MECHMGVTLCQLYAVPHVHSAEGMWPPIAYMLVEWHMNGMPHGCYIVPTACLVACA